MNELLKTAEDIQVGCIYNCRYCSSRYEAVEKKKWCTYEQWIDPVTIRYKVHRSFLKRLDVISYPENHDITTRNLSDSLHVIRSMLEAGNKVRVLSKPNYGCIAEICKLFIKYRKQLSFCFTIGSMDPRVLSFWEPQAPSFDERLQSLQFAFDYGFQTSVSIEPFLDSDVIKTINLYDRIHPFVRGNVWIGSMQGFNNIELLDVLNSDKQKFVYPLKEAQTDVAIWALYYQLIDESLIQWKDSIREVIECSPREDLLGNPKKSVFTPETQQMIDDLQEEGEKLKASIREIIEK